MRKLKLIWEFKGSDAEGTAKHHAIHLNEFAKRENIENSNGYEQLDETTWIAYITVVEDKMPIVRDALRPHRGELAD